MTQADPLGTGHLEGSLKRRALTGGAIAFGSQGLRVLLQFAATILLARLLPPHAFGLVAMVAALTMLLDLVKELGLSAAIIQRPSISQAQISALFWLNLAMSGAIAGTLWLLAPLIAGFYGEPELTPITRWLALGFAMSGLTVQHWALLRRQMRFGAIALLETGAELAGFLVALGVALQGGDYWALVAQRLTIPAIALVGSWALCSWRPDWPRPAAGLGSMIRFGLSVTGFNIVTVATRSLDQALIGWLWGPAILGFYERAARLVLVPVNNINAPLYAVAMPTLSRLETQPAEYRAAYLLVIEKLAMITMPPAALAAVCADWVVALLFGPQWTAAAPFVICFSLAALSQPTMLAAALLYQSQNRSGEMLRAGLVDALIVALAILAGLPFGALGIAAAYAAAGLLLRLPAAFWLAGRKGPVRARDLWAAIAPALAAASVVGAGMLALRRAHLLPDIAFAASIALGGAIALGLSLAVFLLIPRSRRALARLWHLPRLLRA